MEINQKGLDFVDNKTNLENISISDLLAIVRVSDERLAEIQKQANDNQISGFGDHPLVKKWGKLTEFNRLAKNALIAKLKELSSAFDIDISDCF